jgi:hypothetical protein
MIVILRQATAHKGGSKRAMPRNNTNVYNLLRLKDSTLLDACRAEI